MISLGRAMGLICQIANWLKPKHTPQSQSRWERPNDFIGALDLLKEYAIDAELYGVAASISRSVNLLKQFDGFEQINNIEPDLTEAFAALERALEDAAKYVAPSKETLENWILQ